MSEHLQVPGMDREAYLAYLRALLAIDSPTGMTGEIAGALVDMLKDLGLRPRLAVKGGVMASLPCENPVEKPLLLAVHLDTLGLMVSGVKENGRLLVSPIGCLPAAGCEGENVRLYTRTGAVYTGVVQPDNASIHVNPGLEEQKRDFEHMELLLDEPVRSREDVRALGVDNGNYIAIEPRFTVTPSGYLKSRFLDDKLCTALVLALIKAVRDSQAVLRRWVYLHFSVQEEVGYGASAPIPDDVEEFLSLDLGCVGEGLQGSEHKVSICAKDLLGPYDYDLVCGYERAAQRAGADYAVDVYPYYTSDSDAALISGLDLKHGLLGPGVYASHGYERSHLDGVENTFKLLWCYIVKE